MIIKALADIGNVILDVVQLGTEALVGSLAGVPVNLAFLDEAQPPHNRRYRAADDCLFQRPALRYQPTVCPPVPTPSIAAR